MSEVRVKQPVEVSNLEVTLPGGAVLLENVNLTVERGEVVVILGGSGSGKSTLSRALFEPEALLADGFGLTAGAITLDRADLGLVPQRGALFDHLDVGENLELAARAANGKAKTEFGVADWLTQVSLNPTLASASTSEISGGQAQRVAVARALAAGRNILFLDEPSVGLDPARVRELARVIRDQVARRDLAIIVVTHDLALAGGVGDRLLFLDPTQKTLIPLFESEWPGALEDETMPVDLRSQWLSNLELEVVNRIDSVPPQTGSRGSPSSVTNKLTRRARELGKRIARPFAIAAVSPASAIMQLTKAPADFLRVSLRVAKQTLLRPLPFYAIVAALIGYTVLFVISKVGGAGIRPDALIRQIGGSYVLALAPPLSAILFVAASGAASNAWLGSLTLTRQVTALEAIGIKPSAYLLAPTWLTVGFSYLLLSALFTASMIAGGWLLAEQTGVDGAFELLTADFVDPRPDRRAHLLRSLVLFWVYAWGIASDVVAKGSSPKRDADDVTRSMTGSVVSCTLWVVACELFTAIWLFR